MEQEFVTATQRFISAAVGSVNRGQRFPCSARVAFELESMGLVKREVQEVKRPSPDVGAAKPLQLSPAAQALQAQTLNASEVLSGSLSTTAIDLREMLKSSTPATVDGGTPTKKKRGRPFKVNAGRAT